MNEREIFAQRDRQLRDLTAHARLGQDFPLIKETRISPAKYSALHDAAGQYLYASLVAGGHDTLEFDDWEHMTQKYKRELLTLPQVTPNGLLRPKKETYLQFNLVHSCLAEIVKDLRFDEKIQKMRLPLAIRMVDGTADDWVTNRPRANNKLHSDFWTGGCCDLAILCPLLGDVERTTLKFGQPVGMRENFLSELPNYDEGAKLYETYEAYDLRMSKGNLYFQDIYCLHGTWRQGGGLRVSMDWTIQTNNYPEIERRHSSKALATDNHWDLATWYSMGRDLLYVDMESVDETRAKLVDYKKEGELKLGSAIAGQTASTAKVIAPVKSLAELPLARFGQMG